MAEDTPPLRQLLARMVACALVPVMIAAAGLAWWHYGHEKRGMTGRMELAARALSGALDARFVHVQMQLDELSHSIAFDGASPTAAHGLACKLRDAEQLDAVLLVAPSGMQVLSTSAKPGEVLPARWPEPLMGAVRRGRAVVNDLYQGPPQALVGVAVPVVDGNRIAYGLSATLDPRRFCDLLQRQGLPDGWTATIVDRAGVIVARSQDHAHWVGKPFSGPWLPASGVYETGNGAAAYARSNWTGWSVVLEAPDSELYRPLHQIVLWLAAGLLVLALTSLWTVRRYSERILDSMAMLVTEAKQAVMGLPVDLPRLAFREADVFAKIMDEAARELHGHSMALERSERHLRAVLETAMDAVVVLDGSGRIVLFNEEAERMFLVSRDKMLGQTIEALMPERYREGHAVMVRRFAREPGVARQMGRARLVHGMRSNGEEFPVEASISSSRADGEQWMTVIMRDLTGRENIRLM